MAWISGILISALMSCPDLETSSSTMKNKKKEVLRAYPSRCGFEQPHCPPSSFYDPVAPLSHVYVVSTRNSRQEVKRAH